MSGKRQHYIPQFLQKGFAINAEQDSHKRQVWMHRQGATPKKVNTRHVGVENFFYSGFKDPHLDNSITAFESAHNSLLKPDTQITEIDKEAVGNLLAHLEIRTQHLRKSFQASADTLFEETLKFLKSDELLTQLIHDLIEQGSPLFFDAMWSEFRARGFDSKDLSELGLTSQRLKEIMAACIPQFTSMIRSKEKEYALAVSSAGKSGQLKALNKTLAPQSKTERFAELNFEIQRQDEMAFVLGDSIVLFHIDGERPFKPFLEKGDCLRSVYLPLSPNSVLIGSSSPPSFDLKLLSNEIIASSNEFFIADRPFSDSEQSGLIGQNAHLLTSTEIREIVLEAFGSIR